jgi:hypothetical protein
MKYMFFQESMTYLRICTLHFADGGPGRPGQPTTTAAASPAARRPTAFMMYGSAGVDSKPLRRAPARARRLGGRARPQRPAVCQCQWGGGALGLAGAGGTQATSSTSHGAYSAGSVLL